MNIFYNNKHYDFDFDFFDVTSDDVSIRGQFLTSYEEFSKCTVGDCCVSLRLKNLDDGLEYDVEFGPYDIYKNVTAETDETSDTDYWSPSVSFFDFSSTGILSIEWTGKTKEELLNRDTIETIGPINMEYIDSYIDYAGINRDNLYSFSLSTLNDMIEKGKILEYGKAKGEEIFLKKLSKFIGFDINSDNKYRVIATVKQILVNEGLIQRNIIFEGDD